MHSYLAMLILVAGPVALTAQQPRMDLGDLILRNSAGALFRMGAESISSAGDFSRDLPIDIAYQVVSTMDLPDATTTITLVGNAGRDSLPALRIRFPSPIRAGTGTNRHELVVDRIPSGRYRMELTVVDSSSRQLIHRQTFLRLK
ncbi:MAG: hypothetical protein SFU57_05735 [Gemmatimonadales bacterium]|nr:hypothetical protein [Gemmatimonadales bacterium]